MRRSNEHLKLKSTHLVFDDDASDGGAKNDNFHEIQTTQSLRSNNVLVGIIGVGPQCHYLRQIDFT